MGFPSPMTAMACAYAIAIGASAFFSYKDKTIVISFLITGGVLAMFTVWIEKMQTRKEVIKCLIKKI